jgi:hypothetical protein
MLHVWYPCIFSRIYNPSTFYLNVFDVNICILGAQFSGLCTVQLCNASLSTSSNSSCTTGGACYDFRTVNNTSYCAPLGLCSLLDPCINGSRCLSNKSVCIVNSCCVQGNVCLPLVFIEMCSQQNTTNGMISIEFRRNHSPKLSIKHLGAQSTTVSRSQTTTAPTTTITGPTISNTNSGSTSSTTGTQSTSATNSTAQGAIVTTNAIIMTTTQITYTTTVSTAMTCK